MDTSKRKWLPREMASLLLSMQILGLYHAPQHLGYINPMSSEASQERHPLGLLSLQNVWHLSCVVLMLFNFVRVVVAFWWTELEVEVYSLIILAVWTLQCFLNSASLYVSVICQERMGGFFKFWHNYCNGCSFQTTTPLIDRRWLRKTSLYATVLTWVLIVGNLAGIMIQFIPAKPEHRYITAPWITVPALVVSLGIMIFASGSWLFPLAFFSVICKLLGRQFQVLNDSLANPDVPMEKMDFIRKQHTYLCHAVQKADVIFGPILAITYITNVPLTIFIFYQILFAGLETSELILFSFWVLGTCLQLAIVSFDAAVVNDKAHSLKELVYAMEIKTGDLRSLQIQSLLLSRLTGPPVGFTALGFVVVTKELILGAFGAILTYFTILVQFRTPSMLDEETEMTTVMS